ncbi:MAG TPA: YbhB/YbcL family Raf kinase inhibitor-like protein [Candidatus Paceibacterota bacterium]|nr:YbhB/YbcL family Raf kinase inhibitor-like protein [Candidatus Paceibacterota bacterium]
MQITSPAFEHGERIPQAYTCEGDRLLSPELAIDSVPEAAQSLVLIMDDPDVPKVLRPDGNFTHWVLFNIPPATTIIPEGGTLGTSGLNGTGDTGYRGPCPPPDYEPKTHRYFFKLYALDTMLDLPEGATKEDVEAAMSGHILTSAELVGTYSRD